MRLTPAALAQLAISGDVGVPGYEPAQVQVGIVHLGLGNFHRAHQAVYTDAILRQDPRWGICGVSLRSRGVADALNAQGGLYTLLERGPAAGVTNLRARVIGSLREALCGADGMAPVIARIPDPATHIVSLTVTEKGYCHDLASGQLNAAHPDIVHDLAHADAPRSALGVLLRGLQARRAHGAPLTVVCCDNLPHNGATLRQLTLQLAGMMDDGLAQWVECEIAFPSTMVDRIVPASTDADRALVRELGLADDAPLSTEPFSQWVIEDNFANPRPPWEDAGAQLVTDVAPFELMKLRLLNGAHSTLAYLGYLAGHDYIYQVSGEPAFRHLLRALWAELTPTLAPLPGVDLAAYQNDLLARFQNRALPHRTWQIAMDGSQKLPQRLLGAARERLARGFCVDAIALAVAGWMRYVGGVDERGTAIDVRDPLAADYAAIAARAQGNPRALAEGLLGLTVVFGEELAAHPKFRARVIAHLQDLHSAGAAATVRHLYPDCRQPHA